MDFNHPGRTWFGDNVLNASASRLPEYALDRASATELVPFPEIGLGQTLGNPWRGENVDFWSQLGADDEPWLESRTGYPLIPRPRRPQPRGSHITLPSPFEPVDPESTFINPWSSSQTNTPAPLVTQPPFQPAPLITQPPFQPARPTPAEQYANRQPIALSQQMLVERMQVGQHAVVGNWTNATARDQNQIEAELEARRQQRAVGAGRRGGDWESGRGRRGGDRGSGRARRGGGQQGGWGTVIRGEWSEWF